MKKDIYVLGTGLSHDGSACLLKNGRMLVVIEKERITRLKHDGLNDTAAISYCLNAAGLRLQDIDLVVQSALSGGNFDFGNGFFDGDRVFKDYPDIPVVTISHHLAHAYSIVGTCPFEQFKVLVIDGSGSPFEECIDLEGATIPAQRDISPETMHLFYEKDSFYSYEDGRLKTIYKDFASVGYFHKAFPPIYPVIKHSIGGVYQAMSNYVFGSLMDVGKLMGLAPYATRPLSDAQIFDLSGGRVFVNYEALKTLTRPSRGYADFKSNFQYYAELAYWVQREVERALFYVIDSRLDISPGACLGYSGGVALNAVANAKIFSNTKVRELFIQPAAGDNGIGIGCAYYGWLEVLKREKVAHNNSACFGFNYSPMDIQSALQNVKAREDLSLITSSVDHFFTSLNTLTLNGHAQDIQLAVQFDLSNVGSYHVSIDKGKINSRKNPVANPSCYVTADGGDFYRLLKGDVSIDHLLGLKKLQLSSPRNFTLLLELLYLEGCLAPVRQTIEAELLLRKSPVRFHEDPNFINTTARLLSEGKVIGWFQNESEFGPRALGRRSILADPRNSAVRNFVNAKVKFREDFRPFAPSVLREDASIFFKTGRESPYMLLVDDIRPEWREKLSSVVHEDGSSRIQTVTRDWNPKYHQLLHAFKEITGISVLLNTSFNRRDMPIVETPAEAIDFFLECQLDYLVIGSYIVEKT